MIPSSTAPALLALSLVFSACAQKQEARKDVKQYTIE